MLHEAQRYEVWVYSEHSLKTKGFGKPGEAPRGAGAAVSCPGDPTGHCEQEGQREGEVLDGYDKLVKMTQFHFYF